MYSAIGRDLKDTPVFPEVCVIRSSRDVLASRGSLREEMAAASLGDARLNARLDRVIDALEQHPDVGFPSACGGDAETEALYRFLRNPRVSLEAVLTPHVCATVARCRAVGEVLVIHDSTDNVFAGEKARVGLTKVGPRRHEFWLHVALAVSADGLRAPLGVVGLAPWARKTRPARRAKPHWRERFKDPHKESRRWSEGVRAVRGRLGTEVTAIHLMDREGDNYELFADAIQRGERFVIRLNYDRRLATDDESGMTTIATAMPEAVLCVREVPVSARSAGAPSRPRVARRPARARRTATIRITAASVTLKRPPDHRDPLPRMLPVNIVYAWEPAPPHGESPIEWRLVTTEPIETVEQVERIVDWYRTRWLIEEFFKCLKTGCAYERRQLESLDTLLVALGLLAPIAWQLLLVRHLAHHRRDLRATVALTQRQLAVLRTTPSGSTLSTTASVRDALLAVARLGGHLRQNGEPGWLVLTRGMQKLHDMEIGWTAAERSRM